MNRAPVTSSQIVSIGFDSATSTMEIEFTNRGLNRERPNSIYQYAQVTPEVHEALMKAESIGSHFIKNIKPNPQLYPYTKIQ